MQGSPQNWLLTWTSALQWPVIVLAAFALGRYISKLETRVIAAELKLTALIERHLPHIHNALADIKESLAGIAGTLRR